MNKTLIKSSTFALFLKLLNAALSFVYSVLLARLIGKEGTGVYFLAFSVFGLSRIISEFGFRNVLIRFVASYEANENFSALKNLLMYCLSIAAFIALVLNIGLYFLSDYVALYFFKDIMLSHPIAIISFAILPGTLSRLISETFKGIGRYQLSLIIEGVAIFGFGLVIMPLMVSEMGVLGAVQSFVICSYIVFFISTLLFYKIFGKSLYFANTDNIGESKKYIQIGYSFLIITIISFLMSKGTVLLIGLIIHDKGDIGLYAIAERISVMISFGLMAVNAVVAPKFSDFYSNNEFEQLKKLSRQTSFLFLSAAIFGITIICFFSELILSVFGTEFITASSILIVLSIGQVVNLATGSVGILLSMCGYEKILRNIVLSVSISTVLLLLFLVPIYGTLGAAIAISTGLIAQNIIALFIVKQKLGFWVLPKI